METSLSPEALVRLINTEFPQQQSARPKLGQGTPAPTSRRSDSAIGSTTQGDRLDSATKPVDELRPLRPLEVGQPLSPRFGRRFAALLSLIAGFAAVLAITGVSLYVVVYLLVPPADEKLAATTAPTLKAVPPSPEDTAAAAVTMASATAPERTPEFSATNSMPAPVNPPEKAAPIVTVAPGALALGTAPAVAMPAPAPPEEASQIVAVAPDAFAPGTAPAVAMLAPAPLRELRASTAEISALLARGDSLFGVGDVASARLFYERATDAGDAQAALRLGETYDPFFLALARFNGAHGDVVVATRWYRRARDLGASEAEILLKSTESR